MAKLTRTASDARAPRAPRPTHPTRPDDQDSQKTPESPSNSNNLANVDQTPRVPRRSQSLLHGLASASQTDVSRGPSLVEQKARQQLIFVTDATEPCRQPNEYGLDEQPREQTPHTHQHSYDPNAHNNVAVPPANAEHRSSTCVASKIAVKPVLESSRGESDHGHLPDVKALLYGNSRECYSAADIRRFKAACLKYVNGIHPNNIRVHFGDEPIGKEFNWFFDPNDIAPGGLLILFVTGHGMLSPRGVDIKLDQFGPILMDTFVVFGTCNSEAVISGLDRLLVMEDSNTPRRALPFKALFKTLFPGSLVPKLDSKATIIVWAAATEGSPAYPEADLPGRVGENDIMVGAICRALESATGAVPRKILFGKIQEAVVEYNAAREAKYGSRTEAEQNDARIAGKYCGPQLACLLSSHGNRELVLDSPAFEALWGD